LGPPAPGPAFADPETDAYPADVAADGGAGRRPRPAEPTLCFAPQPLYRRGGGVLVQECHHLRVTPEPRTRT